SEDSPRDTSLSALERPVSVSVRKFPPVSELEERFRRETEEVESLRRQGDDVRLQDATYRPSVRAICSDSPKLPPAPMRFNCRSKSCGSAALPSSRCQSNLLAKSALRSRRHLLFPTPSSR